MNRFVRGSSETCIGCRTCMAGCVVAHEGVEMFEKSTGEYSWNPKLEIIKTKELSIAVQCKHCENAACLNSCPVEAISHIDGAVILDQNECIGCKTCILACPYGAIDMIKKSGGRVAANKCDLCKGRDRQECVSVCLTNTLKLVTDRTLHNSTLDKRKRASAHHAAVTPETLQREEQSKR